MRRAHVGATAGPLVVLTALLLAAVPLAPGPAVADPTIARIMIVGDSVTQGESGHYTWRYRLWKDLAARNKSVDFVGPRTTLRNDATDYADPDFDQDHAARWGALMTTDGWWVSGYAEDRTEDLVATYQPDIVIDDLGVNNLLSGATPQQVIDLAAAFVSEARAVDPHVTIVFGQLTQRWFSGVDTYNAALLDLAASLDQADARVLVAPVPADYTRDGDTYDTSHPNAQGEIKIAGQFDAVLATLPLPDRPVPPPYSGAAHLVAAAKPRTIRLTFDAPAGSTSQAVWKRDVTRHSRWRLVAYVGPSAHRYRVASLRRHHLYAFRLRAYQGATASTSFSNVARARAR